MASVAVATLAVAAGVLTLSPGQHYGSPPPITEAVANGSAVSRMEGGFVAIDAARLTPQRYGRNVSLAEIEWLNRQGKAMFNVSNVELACHGITLVFDSQTEADAYGRAFLQRAKAVRAERRATGVNDTDPCAGWHGAIPGV